MNNAVFGKTIEYMRKHKDIKLVATQARKNYLVSQPNYHTAIVFSAIELKKTDIHKKTCLLRSINIRNK